ncbi:MAG TPA: ribbon-helix-helix protein, CopG family [Rhizomicrobium sp.]
MAKRIRKTVTVTARLAPSLLKRLEAYARVSGRTKSWIVEDILDRYVDQEKAFAEAVQVGIRELDAGLGIPHEEVFRKIREKSAERRKAVRRKAA